VEVAVYWPPICINYNTFHSNRQSNFFVQQPLFLQNFIVRRVAFANGKHYASKTQAILPFLDAVPSLWHIIQTQKKPNHVSYYHHYLNCCEERSSTDFRLWCNEPTAMIHPMAKQPSKPFKYDHAEQIILVSSFEWLDFSALSVIGDEFYEILSGLSATTVNPG